MSARRSTGPGCWRCRAERSRRRASAGRRTSPSIVSISEPTRVEEAVLVQHVGGRVGSRHMADRSLVTRDVDPVVEGVATVRRQGVEVDEHRADPVGATRVDRLDRRARCRRSGTSPARSEPIVHPCSAACSAETAMPSAPRESRSPWTSPSTNTSSTVVASKARNASVAEPSTIAGVSRDWVTTSTPRRAAQFVGQVRAEPGRVVERAGLHDVRPGELGSRASRPSRSSPKRRTRS